MAVIFMPERLKEIREKQNLSKAAAARLLCLSKMGYLRYESGERTPSYPTIVFIAQKLSTSPEYLTGETDAPDPLELVITKKEDPELFMLVQNLADKKEPIRARLLAYYNELKSGSKK